MTWTISSTGLSGGVDRGKQFPVGIATLKIYWHRKEEGERERGGRGGGRGSEMEGEGGGAGGRARGKGNEQTRTRRDRQQSGKEVGQTKKSNNVVRDI